MKQHSERTKECKTNTQYIVMYSGYVWAGNQIEGISSKVILDAACGMGYGSNYLSKRALKVVGVDISEEAMKTASKEYRKPNLSFMVMDCTNLKFSDGSFDVVISQDTIEHINEDKKFLSEIFRVLKPEGKLIIFTPHGQNVSFKPQNPYHVRGYNAEQFGKLLNDYFIEIKFYGRRLGKRLEEIEKKLNSVRRYDKLSLRKIIPRKLRHLIGNIVLKIRKGITFDTVSVEDIEYFEGIEDTQTLIVTCKKGKN